LGMVNCTSNPYGNGALDAVAEYCGYADIPIAQFEKPGFLTDGLKYNKYLSTNLSKNYMNGTLKVLPATGFYRDVLNKADDNSVTVVTIGQFNTFCEILKAEPELVNRKVYALVSMAGEYMMGKREYNITCDIASAQYVFANFENHMIMTGSEVGQNILTGFPTMQKPDRNDPIQMAYNLFTDGANVRSSWDLTAVQFAVEGENGMYRLSDSGTNVISDDGRCIFTKHSDGKHNFLVKQKDDAFIAGYLNSILGSFNKKVDK
ncbi:MAG: nucleoside hydrolase, partial [Clostridia bacterium]